MVKGSDFIPHEILEEAWGSAGHGVAYIVDVEAIRKPHVIGSVTKYLTKSLSINEKGVRQEEREATVIGLGETGKIVEFQSVWVAVSNYDDAPMLQSVLESREGY